MIAEDYETVQMLWRIRASIRDVRKVVQIDGDYPDERVLSLEGLLARGHDHLREQPRALSQRLYAVRRQGLAALPYVARTLDRSAGRPADPRRADLPGHGGRRARPASPTPTWCTSRCRCRRCTPRRCSGSSWRAASRSPWRAAATRWSTRWRSCDRRWWPTTAPAPASSCGPAIEEDQPRGLLRRQKTLDKWLRTDVRETFGDRLRYVLCAGAGVDSATAEFFELGGVTVLEAYGAAETGGAVAIALPEDAGSRTAGHPLPGPTSGSPPRGRSWSPVPGLADGYHARRVVPLTQADPGWWRTGDAGVLDAEGRLRVLGRYVERTSG